MGALIDLEEARSARLPALRLGTLELQGARVRLLADVSLTADAAETLAANLIEMARKAREATT